MANEHSQIVPSMQPTAKVADFKFWCQKVLPLVYDDSLSYYEVLNKMVVYLNQVIDNINADIDNVAELEDDFLLLQEYVNNFFDDIDQLVTYAERAEAAETAALSSAASAAESASNSASSASNSASSASSAATSALSAMDAKDAAVAAKTAAETALANAQTAATNAAASATAASGSATNAAASAASALQNFQLSDAARTAAQSAASSAESDAADAADSADEALAALDTISNSIGNIAKTIENEGIAHVDDALASIPKKLAVDIVPVQSGSGDPSPENVRPITGWTGANVQRTGKNLFHGEIPVTIFIKAGETVTISGKSDGAYQLTTQIERADGTRYSAVAVISEGSTSGSITRIIPNDGVGLRIYASGGGSMSNFSNIQIEVGSSATDYETYTIQSIPITFPVDAGTVYGGTLTYENGEWKLRVDMGIYVFTGNETWNTTSTPNRFSAFLQTVLPIPMAAQTMITNAKQNVISSIFGEFIYKNTDGVAYIVSPSDSNRQLVVNTTAASTAQEIAQVFAGTQLVYELATPIDYTLSETQVITLLNGINNIWADTGNINTLEYFTNAENYITSQIDLAKALIAPVLKEMKADTALVANDFRIVGNTLYRITGNIASGGTLTPNTNCVATTVGAILKSLLSA